MKIAIVQDELVRKGGAEQVVLSFHKAFPDAPIYTLSYNENATYPEFKECDVRTSWFGKIIKDDKNLKRFFFPFGVMAMKKIDLKGYDVVLQSTTHCAKYVNVDPKTTVITYCHTPFRLVYRPNSYESVKRSSLFKRMLYDTIISILKKIDQNAAKRTDWFLTNAAEVVPRIVEAYRPEKEVTVINPAVKQEDFYYSKSEKEYFLVVSRFEPYKKVDLVVEVFNQMPEKKLIIVGSGSMESELRLKAKKNILFLSGLNKKGLADVYAECKALIFPQHEDYGITPLEANASGRPVIAFGKGGVLDTMIPYNGIDEQCTAVFFDEQNIMSLTGAIEKFEKISFNPDFILNHAKKFSEERFIREIRNFVEKHSKT